MSRERRVKAMREVTKELKELEGVEDAILDDFAPNTAQSGQIVLIVEGEEEFTGVYHLEPNLRSLAQRMRYKLKDSDLFNFAVYEKPKTVYNVHDDMIGHDSKSYMVDVTP
jgi:16S rRNA C1402 (ribose-2'-O) methylase RsmI